MGMYRNVLIRCELRIAFGGLWLFSGFLFCCMATGPKKSAAAGKFRTGVKAVLLSLGRKLAETRSPNHHKFSDHIPSTLWHPHLHHLLHRLRWEHRCFMIF